MKSPSKYCSLNYLIFITENDFCNKDKGIDYVASEVIDLIYAKQNIKSEKYNEKCFRDYETQRMLYFKSKGIKICSKCGCPLEFKFFDKDKSKPGFELRSWCKSCRKLYTPGKTQLQ